MEIGKLLRWLSGLTGLLIAVILVVFTLAVIYQVNPTVFSGKEAWHVPSLENDLPPGTKGQLIRYGYYLTSESPKWMGPQAIDPEHRFSGNNLACKNCHLNNGTLPGSASWVGVTERYPQFRGRENRIGTIEDRINGCMERSMNGKPLPADSKQMKAIVAYMEWLSEDIPEDQLDFYAGFPSVTPIKEKADPVKGKLIYDRECEVCHGADGQGIVLSDPTKGYQYPPLWGNDSYNHGAGMNRVLTAAAFIKGNMPFGQATAEQPKLSDEEAIHVAAYIDSFARPVKENAEDDFPNRLLKPVSTPYGPWPDSFPAEQHKYGPFQPMIDYYRKEHDIKKSK